MDGQASTSREPGAQPGRKALSFELFVRPGFAHLELSAILSVLRIANDLARDVRFDWQITSDAPGLVTSHAAMMVRAEPAVGTQYLHDVLFVVGGQDCAPAGWLPRVRAMQKLRRPVFLLSDAATEYIKASAPVSGPVTTHWQDARALQEIGTFDTLTTRLVENNSGIHTCAGLVHTTEIVIHLLSSYLPPQEQAELASTMIVDNVRGFDRDQPRGVGANQNFLEGRLMNAIALMEETVEEPLPTAEIADRVGVSVRHLERLFVVYLGTSPARYYKQVRLKLARRLLTETNLPIFEIALACGFAASSSLSKAYRQEYGETPRRTRGPQQGGAWDEG